MQVPFAVPRSHLLGENLQTVPVGVKEVHALGENVVSRELYPGTVALEPRVELPQLLLTSVDL